MRSFSITWICIFVISLTFIWASVDAAAAFVAFWFGLIGWCIGQAWPAEWPKES
jgi:hypothetical protein